jgi:hypothetical protein
MECTHNFEYVKRIKSNGGLLINKQCFICGYLDAKSAMKQLQN